MLWCVVKLSPDHPSWDRQWRPIITVTDGVIFRGRLSVCESFRKYSKQCYGVGWKYWWIVPIGTDRNDPSEPWWTGMFRNRFSVHDIYGSVMERGENVRRSSRSWRIMTTHHDRDRWRHFVTICQFVRDNIQGDQILISTTPYWNSNRAVVRLLHVVEFD